MPIVADDSPRAAVPITGNLIVLGNRSTNQAIRALYDLYYCLVDLKYPGPEGYVLRSVHDPFGDGNGIVVVGASDDVGLRGEAGALVSVLSNTPSVHGELSIGWTMETKLGKGLEPPSDIKAFETWEASRGYGSVGYFGWTSISKRMAMYYMTGDESSAREIVRLSFPDEGALKDIEEIDGERIENKQDPLAGFYHYNAHMAILFWDLIEESQVFTDEERLRITNAFARQLDHRKGEGVYGLTQSRGAVSSRHGQWSAISLYCLGRYFNKYYPASVWAQCMRGGELAFHSLHEHTWIDGEPAQVTHRDGAFWMQLLKGRHSLDGASPAADVVAELESALKRLLETGRTLRAGALEAGRQQPGPKAPTLPVAVDAHVGGAVVEMIAIPTAMGTRLAVAEGSTIHVLTPGGQEVRALEAAGKIRVLHWWDERHLLLAGRADENVIAFDDNGERRCVFTSEMGPAVYRAAKTYWFKSAPGHEGIHGLYTGVFDQGKPRCFVGSACTLEILDETGRLVKRTPVFWGSGRMFLLVAGGDDSRNLLVSRWPNGNDHLAIVNSETMSVTGRGYHGVPTGHSYVGGWTAQNRTRLCHEDLDADGQRELVSATNGTWNRVTVYSESGQPLHNAQFGPGARSAPRAYLRDMDAADFNGDGKREIIVAISEGLVVALNHECQKMWSTRLPSPPACLRCFVPPGKRPPWIVAGCDDGTVVALDHRATLVGLGHVTGRPTHILSLHTPAGALAVLATDKGEVQVFTIGG